MRLTAPRASGWRKAMLMSAALFAAAGAVWFAVARGEAATLVGRNAHNSAPAAIVAASAEAQNVNVTLHALGSVTSLVTVAVKTQISGQLVEVASTEGQMVQKGDLIAQIDAGPYELALALAEAVLKKDQALLDQAELDLVRYKDDITTDPISQQQFDRQQSLVIRYHGNVAADLVQVDIAKLNVAYCRIVAPVSGRVGIRLVDAGNYVTPDDAGGIVVINQISPISVIFSLPQENIPEVLNCLDSGATLPVTAIDRRGERRLATGSLSTLDNQIDITTGTIKLRAVFDNKDGALFPNQLVNVELVVTGRQNDGGR